MSKTALAISEDNIPAHIKNAAGRGNENVGQQVTIPRVKLLQKMSDEVDKHHANYVDGAEVGHFLNTLTGENYGEELYALSITFKTEHVVWRAREAGGGLLGAFSSNMEAQDMINQQEKPADYTITETHTHLLLLKNPKTGKLEQTPIVMDFASSKLRISRNWNSQIALKGGDRFAGLWKIKSVAVENRMGNAFMNLDVSFEGWSQEDDYKAAEKVYEQHSK